MKSEGRKEGILLSYLENGGVEDQHVALQVLLHHPQCQTIRLDVANLHRVYRECAHGRGEVRGRRRGACFYP